MRLLAGLNRSIFTCNVTGRTFTLVTGCEFLDSSVDVIWVACGPSHCAVVGVSGYAYTWGHGAHGKLGQGSDQNK